MPLRRAFVFACFLACTGLICCAGAQAPVPPSASSTPPAYESNPKFIAAIAEAKSLEKQRQYIFARDSYAKANKAAGGDCAACLIKMAQLDEGQHSWKDAIAESKHLQAVATTPRDKSIAEGTLGEILLQQGGDKPKPAQLEAAHAALQAAITDFPGNLSARWTDGCVLAHLGKDQDASQQFTVCAQSSPPSNPLHVRAQHFAADPSLSLQKMAPAFEVTALDGSSFNLDDMTGRVVLIDFWATWCGPCNAALPQMQKIAKEFANEPLTIISISWDQDEARWKDFIASHNMTWIQYRDADHKLALRFGINAIPHYFTIDSDGVLTAEMVGEDSSLEGKLKKLLKRARESRPAAEQASANVSGNE